MLDWVKVESWRRRRKGEMEAVTSVLSHKFRMLTSSVNHA